MHKMERQTYILELLSARAPLRVTALSENLGVSVATVRRDLTVLQDQGFLRRTHGAVIPAANAVPEPPVMQRIAEESHAKQRIGKAAASQIQEGETVFIGSGTTTLELARQLCGRKCITVITNSLPVINTLSQEPGITLISTGGLVRSSELSHVGHIAEQALRELRPQKVFMGIRAVSVTHGLTSDHVPEVSTDRVIIGSAPKVLLLVDHTKFGKVATAFVASITEIHTIITDSNASPDVLWECRQLGVEVLVV